MTREEILLRINGLEKYFLRNYSEGKDSFLPEYKLSKKISKIIYKLDKLSLTDIEEILAIHNAINQSDHHYGSGWMDYQMQLLNLIQHDEVDIKLDNSGQMKLNID